jgi:hypothetical protein
MIALAGCAARPQIVQGVSIALPKQPPVVVIDSGKIDKSKFPNTTWIKPPVVDNEKRQAWWGFEDVEKISESLTLWPLWGRDVKELVEGQNKFVGGEGQKEQRPWYRVW